MVGKTARLWVRLLWDDKRVVWHELADDARIRAAFASMAATCTRWPAPAKFWDHLKARPKPKPSTTLMDPRAGRENEPEVLRRMYAQFAELGLDRNGDPLDQAA